MNPLFDANLPPDLPQVHALVIGINNYPHLPGGARYDGEPAPKDFGLGQLTSPAVSAKALADWLLTRHHNPTTPLGSIELLLSPKTYRPSIAASAKLGVTPGTALPVEIAEFPPIKAAAARWYLRANKCRDNIALFYYCGHGLEASDRYLLPADFGADPFDWTANLINFTATYNNLDRCLAQTQCFFLDSCRDQPDELQSHAARQPTGQALIGPQPGNPKDRDAPIYHAAAPGRAAAGPSGGRSYFTRALLACLNGMGARQPTGELAPIDYNSLGTALRELVDRLGEMKKVRLRCAVGGETLLPQPADLHLATMPVKVLTWISCQPLNAHQIAQLTLKDSLGSVKLRAKPEPKPWRLVVAVGTYEVAARFSPGQPYDDRVLNEIVSPPVFRPRIEIAAPCWAAPREGITGRSELMSSITIEFDKRLRHAWGTPVPVEVFDEGLKLVADRVVHLGTQEQVDVSEPGLYLVRAELPTGELVSATVRVPAEAPVTLVAAEGSSDETLAWAYAQRSGRRASRRPNTRPRAGTSSAPGRVRPGVEITGLFRISPNRTRWTMEPVSVIAEEDVTVVNDDPRLVKSVHYMRTEYGAPRDCDCWCPLYVRTSGRTIPGEPEHVGFVALPMGQQARLLFVRTDDDPRNGGVIRALVSGSVGPGAEALLAYLDQGAFGAAKRIGESVTHMAIDMLQATMTDPFAAVIAGYFLLRTKRLEKQDWMRNLANWFPNIPDGAVIYGMSLLRGAEVGPNERREARRYLLMAVKRGIPAYTVGLRLVFDGLRSLVDDMDRDSALRTALARIRYIAAYTDWDAQNTTFSVPRDTTDLPFTLPQ